MRNDDSLEQKQKTKKNSTSSCFYFLRHIRLVSKKRGMYTYIGYLIYLSI